MARADTCSLIEKYGGEVPRYTSYPTALQFHNRLTAADVGDRLRTLRANEDISLYIHIPFCHSLCHYCGCHTKIVNHTGVISTYIDLLCREIGMAAAMVPRDVHIRRLHFGGGSPNYAPVDDIRKILDTVRASFPRHDAMQIDMECDPRLLTKEKISALARAGIVRVSLGVQDFDEKVQKAVNRIQTVDHIARQVGYLREHGITDINFDLIVGLPEQTVGTICATAAQTVVMAPQRISVFGYAHVPWMKKHQKLLEQFRLPTPQERFEWQNAIRDDLGNAGYISIGIDHYAKPTHPLALAHARNTLQRNFQGYTDDPSRVILGFGLSAISQFHDAYAQNTVDSSVYRAAIDTASLPTVRGYVLSPEDQTARDTIMRVMCYGAAPLPQSEDIFVDWHRLLTLEEDGLITCQNDTVSVTDMGSPFTRVVASCFDRYRKDGHGRHAKAV